MVPNAAPSPAGFPAQSLGPPAWPPSEWSPMVLSVWELALWFFSGDLEISWGQLEWKARPLDLNNPQGLGAAQAPMPHSEGERAPGEGHSPTVFSSKEGRVIPSGKGPYWGEVPTVTASSLVSHGALPGEGPTCNFTPWFQMEV